MTRQIFALALVILALIGLLATAYCARLCGPADAPGPSIGGVFKVGGC